MNYIYSIEQNRRSLEILKKIYNDKKIRVTDKGCILLSNKYVIINNKRMLIHNMDTLKLKRKYKNEYEFLNFIENYYQRIFIIDKFLEINNNLHFESKERKNKHNEKYYFYSIVNSETEEKILSLKSKINSDKKLITLIMLFYKIS